MVSSFVARRLRGHSDTVGATRQQERLIRRFGWMKTNRIPDRNTGPNLFSEEGNEGHRHMRFRALLVLICGPSIVHSPHARIFSPVAIVFKERVLRATLEEMGPVVRALLPNSSVARSRVHSSSPWTSRCANRTVI